MVVNLKDYERFVKEIVRSNARVDGGHILAESNAHRVRHALETVLSDEMTQAIVKRTCGYKNCINPAHFLVKFRKKQDIASSTQEELDILMSDIDFDAIEEVGAVEYLAEYNREMPDELKISLPTLKSCIKLHRKKKSKAEKAENEEKQNGRSSEDMKNALTIKQFAEGIGFSPEWVSRLIKKGKITPRVRGAGQRYFLQSDVEDWLNGNPSPLFNRESE